MTATPGHTTSHYTTTATPIRARIRSNPAIDVTTINDPTPVFIHAGWTWGIYCGPHPIEYGEHAMRGVTGSWQDAVDSACSALKWLSTRTPMAGS